MPAQIPAGQPSGVRKQSANAGLRRRRLEDEFRFAALLVNSIVLRDHDRAVCGSTDGDAQAEDSVVHNEGQGHCSGGYEHDCEKESAEPVSERHGVHRGCRIICRVAGSDGRQGSREAPEVCILSLTNAHSTGKLPHSPGNALASIESGGPGRNRLSRPYTQS